MKLEFTRTPNGYKVIVDNNLRVKEYLSIPSFDEYPTTDTLNDNDPDEPAIGFFQGSLMLWDGTEWIEAGGGIKQEDIGRGLIFGTNGKLTLDLTTLTLVSPSISSTWTLYKNDGTTAYSPATSNGANITVDKGVKANLTANYTYPAASVGQASPTGKTGDFPGGLPGDNTPSPTLSVTAYTSSIQASKTYSIGLTKDKSGLIVTNNQVQFPSGVDVTGASISISFKGRSALVSSASTSLNAADIQTLLNTGAAGNAAFVDARARTFAGVTASGYLYYILDQSFGRPTSVIQNDALPVKDAFIFLSDVTIVNAAGLSVPITVMRSGDPNAFVNAKLAFS